MRWLAVAMVVACGGKPPEPLEPPRNEAPRPRPRQLTSFDVTAPRPNIDIDAYLPDFHEELRWPLGGMAHPKLEPSFPIAIALASPGVGWLDLCAMGAQNRHLSRGAELQSYLRGWCSVVKGDVDAACKHLVPLFGSITRGLASAVRTDLANILVDLREIDKVEHWLNKHRIRDIATLDLLAASFVELGMLDAAQVINRRAIDGDYQAKAATTCHRLVRSIVLSNHNDLSAQSALEKLATAKVPDETCQELFEEIVCAQNRNMRCLAYHARHNINSDASIVLDVYNDWPHGAAPRSVWYLIATRAMTAVMPEGTELAVAAFEAAVQANGNSCSGDAVLVGAIKNLGQWIKSSQNAASFEPRVEKLHEQCWSTWVAAGGKRVNSAR